MTTSGEFIGQIHGDALHATDFQRIEYLSYFHRLDVVRFKVRVCDRAEDPFTLAPAVSFPNNALVKRNMTLANIRNGDFLQVVFRGVALEVSGIRFKDLSECGRRFGAGSIRRKCRAIHCGQHFADSARVRSDNWCSKRQCQRDHAGI